MPLTPDGTMVEGRCCSAILEVDGRVIGSCEYPHCHGSLQHRFRTLGVSYGLGDVLVDIRWHAVETQPTE